MSDTENAEPTPEVEATPDEQPSEEQANEAGAEQVQSAIDEEQEQGYRGVATDETPNHAYTVAGVLAGEETPETKENDSE